MQYSSSSRLASDAWSSPRIAGLNNAVCLRIEDQDGEVVERRTPAKDLEAEIERLVKEQLVDGFAER